MAIVLNGTTGITAPDIDVTAQSTDIVTTGDVSAVDGTFSGGVYLGGTGSANYLDDYEEGTWTPVTSQGSATTSGFYRKIGNFVSVCCVISDVNNNTSTADTAITGLPFTSANNTNVISIGSCLLRYYAPSTTPMQVIGYVAGNTSQIRLYKMFAGGANWDRIPYTDFSRADWDAQVFISYYTD